MTFTRLSKNFETRGNVEKRDKYRTNKHKLCMKTYDRKKMYKIKTFNPVEFLGERELTHYEKMSTIAEICEQYKFYQTRN
jgi:hypothetical protein